MRTLLLVLVILLLALAAGLGLALPAGAQGAPAATLDVHCDGGGADLAVASREYVLVTCTATVHNTGTAALAGAQLAFAPASNLAPPDTYIFWSASLDGTPLGVGPAQLTHDLGELAPGTRRKLAVSVILRSARDFGADLLLLAQPDHEVYARQTIVGKALAEGGATVPVVLTREATAAAVPANVAYELVVRNTGAVPDAAVSAELAPGVNVRLVDPAGWTTEPVSGHLLADFGPLAAGATVRRRFTLESATGGCATAQPVVLVTTRRGGVVRLQPLVDQGTLLNFCGGGEGGGLLPATGSGPTRSGPPERTPLPAALLATVGLLALAMAATARHAGRRRREAPAQPSARHQEPPTSAPGRQPKAES